jgi:hypothetical protein
VNKEIGAYETLSFPRYTNFGGMTSPFSSSSGVTLKHARIHAALNQKLARPKLIPGHILIAMFNPQLMEDPGDDLPTAKTKRCVSFRIRNTLIRLQLTVWCEEAGRVKLGWFWENILVVHERPLSQ